MYTMKKLLFIAILASITFTSQAQTEFSIVAGFANSSEQDDFVNQGFGTGAGYYVGLGAELSLTKGSSIYSELTYGNINATNYIQLPVLYKYNFTNNVSVLAGPQLGFVYITNRDDISSFSIGLGAAIRYDFSDKFYAITRYNFQLNEHTSNRFPDANYRINVANVGFGYKLF